MLKLVLIGLGGFLGAIARYGLSGLVQRCCGGSFPTGTLAVNVSGCFAIGVLMYLVEERGLFDPDARRFLQVGFLGAFTTFSTVGYETFEMLRSGDLRLALANVLGSVVLGVGAVAVGWKAGKAIGL